VGEIGHKDFPLFNFLLEFADVVFHRGGHGVEILRKFSNFLTAPPDRNPAFIVPGRHLIGRLGQTAQRIRNREGKPQQGGAAQQRGGDDGGTVDPHQLLSLGVHAGEVGQGFDIIRLSGKIHPGNGLQGGLAVHVHKGPALLGGSQPVDKGIGMIGRGLLRIANCQPLRLIRPHHFCDLILNLFCPGLNRRAVFRQRVKHLSRVFIGGQHRVPPAVGHGIRCRLNQRKAARAHSHHDDAVGRAEYFPGKFHRSSALNR